MQNVRSQRDRGRRIALRRLGDDLRGRYFGQLADDLVANEIIGQDPDALGRYQGRQTVHRFLNQRSLPRDLEDLLGVTLPAARPKPRTPSAGQNEAVVIRLRHVLWSAPY